MGLYTPEITVSDFVTELMNEFGLDGSNENEGTSSSAVLGYVDDANREFLEHRAWNFRLTHFSGYKLPDTKVKTAFTTASVTLELDNTADYPNTGYIMVDGDIIKFTNNNTSNNTLTIDSTTIDRDHEASELVWYLNPVPADFCKISDFWLNQVRVFIDDQRNTMFPQPYRLWEVTVRQVDGTFPKFFMFWHNTKKEKYYLKYGALAKNLQLNPTTTFMEIPPKYRDFVKESVFARIYKHLEDIELASVSEKKARGILMASAVDDAKKHFSTRMTLKTEWDNPQARLYSTKYNRQ